MATEHRCRCLQIPLSIACAAARQRLRLVLRSVLMPPTRYTMPVSARDGLIICAPTTTQQRRMKHTNISGYEISPNCLKKADHILHRRLASGQTLVECLLGVVYGVIYLVQSNLGWPFGGWTTGEVENPPFGLFPTKQMEHMLLGCALDQLAPKI